MKNENLPKSLVPIHNMEITKVQKSIQITGKLIQNKVETLFNHAFLLINSKQGLDKTINYFDLLNNDPNVLLTRQYSFEAISNNDYLSAVKMLNQIIILKPEHINSLILRAIAADKFGNDFYLQTSVEFSNEIYEGLNIALEINPSHPVVLFWRGNFECGNSLLDYSKALKITNNYSEIYSERGMAFRSGYSSTKRALSKSKLAIRDLTTALNFDNQNANIFFNRAVIKNDILDFTGAIEDFTKGISLDPNNFKAFFCRGITNFYINKYIDAISDFNEIIKNVGQFEMEWYGVGKQNEINFQFFDQIGYSSPFLCGKEGTQYVNVYYFLGLAKIHLDLFEEAITDLLKALESRPNDRIYFQIGVAKSCLQNFQESVDFYTKAIELNPRNAGSFLNRARAKCQLKDYSGAIDDYSMLFTIVEQSCDGGSLIYERGLLYHDLKNFKGALHDYNLAIRFGIENAEIYFNRGEVKYNLNDFEGAILDYSKVLELDPFNIKAYHYRSFAKMKINDIEGAKDDHFEYNKIRKNK